MYNLYSMTGANATICELAGVVRDSTGFECSMPAIVPQQLAPVVRVAPDGIRELISMRWGLPTPTSTQAGLVTSIRNPTSHWWKPGLRIERRCLVPVTSFCDYFGKPPEPVWFAIDKTRPLFFVAGVWRPWAGNPSQNSLPATGDHLLYSFLTTETKADRMEPNPKAIPVLLLDESARNTWLGGSLEQALALARAASDNALGVRAVAIGKRQDGRPNTRAA